MSDAPPLDDDAERAVTHPSRPSLLSRTSAAGIARADSSASSTASAGSSSLHYPNASNALFGHPGYLPGVAHSASERVYPHATEGKFYGQPSPRSPQASSSEVEDAGWLNQSRLSGASESSLGPQTDSLRLASKVVAPTSEFLLKTARFKHAAVDGINLVLTGRAGELIRCEDEPIHCPGAVQSFAVLLAFDVLPSGVFHNVQVTENSTAILGIHPSQFFDAHCLTDLFDDDGGETLRDALSMVDETADEATISPYTFELAGPPTEDPWIAYAAMHRPSRSTLPDRVILELELVSDTFVNTAPHFSHPERPQSPLISPPMTPSESGPEMALGHPSQPSHPIPDLRPGMASKSTTQPSVDDIRQSTTPSIRPLQEMAKLQRTRARQAAGNAGRRPGPEARQGNNLFLVQLMTEIEGEFRKATDVMHFAKIIAGCFRALTGFDRTMVYKFDQDWNGEVIAEEVDATRTKDLFRGLHFPSTDIPPQARELYKINKVRLLDSRDEPTARLCCRDPEEVTRTLDMTHCFSRAMSPIHLQYLSNMKVSSTMSISIVVFGVLWGLVACHHYGPGGFRISFPLRQLCKLLSDSFGRNIERLIMSQRIEASKKIINTRPTSEHPNGFIVATAANLLELFNADFGALSIGDEAKILGNVENSQEVLAILNYLREHRISNVLSTTDIAADFPAIPYPSHLAAVAGFLAIPLSENGRDFIFFCRRSQLTSIQWAGNPYKTSSDCVLDPRTSFQSWSESVMGKCRPWTDELVDTPQALMLIYGKFIDVWREKESLVSAHRIAHHLLRDASQAIRTPLQTIIDCLEVALSGELDAETRASVNTSYHASQSLVHVINNLLDMTRTESGRELSVRHPFDISAVIEEAVEVHRSESVSKGVTLEIFESRIGSVPAILFGDPVQVRRAVTNLLSNALRHTKEGGVRVDWGVMKAEAGLELPIPGAVTVGISVTDTGCGISSTRLEQMFREFERLSVLGPAVASSTAGSITLPSTSSRPSTPPEGSVTGVGLGLALVARTVRTLGGQLRIASRVGEGSRFTLVLPLSIDGGSLLPLDPLEPAGFSDFVRPVPRPGRPAGIDAMLAQLASVTPGTPSSRGSSTRSRSSSVGSTREVTIG